MASRLSLIPPWGDVRRGGSRKIGYEVLLEKVIRYGAVVPERVVYLTAGIDSQANRFEMYVWGWAPGEEAFLIDKKSLWGDPIMRKP